ncbi:glycosyl hydrolase family 79 C-terminal domain-containing protein [Mucilaginibacter sp. UYCu711]|uniref:glycosyl hydrolase family 79 C-terminal domain-containing protein n=1 Tax=Mucilaginibacter sp. UYCu711 TaxID=3156339 RepID=UPI003D1EEA9B
MKHKYKTQPGNTRLFTFFGAIIFLISFGHAYGQKVPVPVTITIDLKKKGPIIPDDFTGLSFETGSERIGNAGVKGYFFDAESKQVLNLFKELGIKHLRVGGGSVDIKTIEPTTADIDHFFGFVKAADVKVLYSFRLLNGNAAVNAGIAKYIWSKYGSYIDCFSIGNEPDWRSYHQTDPEITDYPSYYKKWKRFQQAILDSVPAATFTGPETGSNYPVAGAKNTNYNDKSWTVNFATDEKGSKLINYISLHNYAGQDAPGNTIESLIEKMLSPNMAKVNFPALYETDLVPVRKAGFKYRVTESNSFSGDVAGSSNSFAAALFALDYMHWWAAHKAAGVNFHNKQWVKNAPIYKDAAGNFNAYPIGYGIKAFNIGGHGTVQPVTIANPEGINLTAYAVSATHGLYITIINKSYGDGAKDALITIKAPSTGKKIATMSLNTQDNNITALTGVTLGGAPISNSGPWQGKWTPVKIKKAGNCVVQVPASSAIIVKIN